MTTIHQSSKNRRKQPCRNPAKRVVLVSRPVGEPKASDFRVEDYALPTPGEGQVLLRTIWLSLDPYMRGRMSDGPSYAAPVPIGGVMEGGTVSEVIASNNPGFAKGDIVLYNTNGKGRRPTTGNDLNIDGSRQASATNIQFTQIKLVKENQIPSKEGGPPNPIGCRNGSTGVPRVEPYTRILTQRFFHSQLRWP